ncbi:MAG: transcriptional repressor LexA [Pseudomonadota bacterium]
MLPTLTNRQQEVLEVIKSRIEEIGAPPTQAEIAQTMGFASKNAARDHLLALERKGYIKLHGDKNRAIQIIAPQENEVPIIGSVAAGSPIEAIENIEKSVPIPHGVFRKRPTFLLRVKGDSMKDIGILDGDLIAVQKSEFAELGQIVVARVNNEVTVKRLGKNEENMLLIPENSAYQPIEVPPNELFIEGHFIGLIRDVG